MDLQPSYTAPVHLSGIHGLQYAAPSAVRPIHHHSLQIEGNALELQVEVDGSHLTQSYAQCALEASLGKENPTLLHEVRPLIVTVIGNATHTTKENIARAFIALTRATCVAVSTEGRPVIVCAREDSPYLGHAELPPVIPYRRSEPTTPPFRVATMAA